MRNSLVLLLALVATGACKKKSTENKGSASGASGASAGTAGGGSPTGDGTKSATTEAGGPLQQVNECPPALKDTDKGLRRTIPAGCTTTVQGDYYVEGELIIEAGATLKFAADSALYVGYTDASKLIVNGSKDKPVTFASGGDQAPGTWKGVHLYSRAARSQVTGLVIEYALIGLESEAPELSVKDSLIRGTRDVGIKISDEGTLAAFAGNTFDKPGALAMTVPPAAMVGFGAGNVFPADALVELRAGNVSTSGTWSHPGAPIKVTGEVYIDGKAGKATIEVAAGNQFRIDTSGAIYVGYTGDAELKVAGTKDAPVTFVAAGDPEPGAWERGIISYARGTLTLDHAVISHGGADGRGAVRAEGGKLSITSSTIKDNVVGISVDDQGDLRGFDQNQLAGNRDHALVVFPRHLGALGAANTYDAQKLLVHGGRVDKAATWAIQPGATVIIDGELYVEGGALTLPAGSTYAFTDNAGVYVGYSGDGTLVVQGTADKPVTLESTRHETGGWKGVELYGRTVASSLQHLVVKDAAGGGVRVSGGGVVKIEGLTCSACEKAALTWDCQSKVTQSAVKGDAGTPKGALAPEGC